MLKADFLQPAADRRDPEGPERFKTQMTNEFLKPSQQLKVFENGMHQSFGLDAARRSIDTFNGQPIPADVQGPEAIAAYSEQRLRELVGDEHAGFLPFISMMASQAGMNSAPSYLPSQLGLSDLGDAHLTKAELMPVGLESNMSIDREGDDLIIRTTFHGNYININNDAMPGPVLSREGTVSLRIHLERPPIEHVVTMPETSEHPERDVAVLMPQFTVENAEVRYIVPNQGVAV